MPSAKLFFPYFQAYSSTNAPIESLRERYGEAMEAVESSAPGSLRGIVVSTRPDCVDTEVARLLASFARSGLEVWVELGLQSSHDRTLARIRRGHDYAAFVRARELLAEAGGVRAAAHLILGLPGETRHDLLVPLGSALAEEYLRGDFRLLPRESLPALLADCIERLPPECEVIRLCSDADDEELVAPKGRPDKSQLYRDVEAELAARNARQGDLLG